MRDEQIAAIAAALHGRITKRHYWYANATKIECDDGEAEESEATALYDAGLHRAADDVTATAPSDSGVTPSSARPSAGDIRDAEDLIDREDDGFGTAAAWNILQRRDEWDAYDAAHRAEQPEKGRVLPTRQRPILSIDPEEGRDGR